MEWHYKKPCNYKNFLPVFSAKSHMCFEKPPNLLLFETHVASRRIKSKNSTKNRPVHRTHTGVQRPGRPHSAVNNRLTGSVPELR